MGSAWGNYWGKIYEEDRRLEFRLYFIVVGDWKDTMALEAFLAITSGNVLHRRQTVNSWDSKWFTRKRFIADTKLFEQRPLEKTINWIAFKVKDFQSSIRKIQLMIDIFYYYLLKFDIFKDKMFDCKIESMKKKKNIKVVGYRCIFIVYLAEWRSFNLMQQKLQKHFFRSRIISYDLCGSKLYGWFFSML